MDHQNNKKTENSPTGNSTCVNIQPPVVKVEGYIQRAATGKREPFSFTTTATPTTTIDND